MTSPHPTEPADGIRQFTVIAWLLWTLIPALAVGALGWMTDYVKESAGNTDPAGLMAAMAAGIYMTLLLVPVVTTLQWLILRRVWPKLFWAAWLLVVVVSLASVMAGPIVMMKSGSPLYGAVPPILTIGLAAAAALSIASPKPLRRSAFAIIFLSFLSGGALIWGIEFNPLIGLFLLESSFPFNSFTAHPSYLATVQSHIYSFIFYHRDLLSLACGTAASGFGLWLVSRCASRNEAALPASDHVS